MSSPASAGAARCARRSRTRSLQAAHLKARDTTLLLASWAPLQKLLAYRERMGWPVDWVSSSGSDFNRDLGFLSTAEELKPFLQGDIPITVEQNARMCGTDAGGYVAEGPGLKDVQPLANTFSIGPGPILGSFGSAGPMSLPGRLGRV
jgi:Bacterial protein of unknown function (DUF899)